MPFDWKKLKGYKPRKNGKSDSEMFLDTDQIEKILNAVKNGPAKPEKKKRDWMAIFLGFSLGLRVTETVILDRATFRDIHHPNGMPYVKTLKRSERILIVCPGCGVAVRVAASRDGQTWPCKTARCDTAIPIKKPKSRYIQTGPPEIQSPVFGDLARKHTLEYLDWMPAKQMWLFVGGDMNKHMSSNHLEGVFAQYVSMAGLSPKYSWHSLRHGLGSFLWERTNDQKMVQSALRQKNFNSSERYMDLSKRSKEKALTAINEIGLGSK